MPDLHLDATQASGKPGVPLGTLLNLTARDIHDALKQHVEDHAARGQVQAAAFDLLAEDAAREVCEKLRVDAFALALQAWAAVRELQDYADPAKHPAGEVNVVQWGRCSIDAPQAVDVRLAVLGIELPVLRLRIDLRADFQSLALTIRDGALRKVTPGPAKVSAGVRCGEATLVRERSTPELSFPFGVDFEPGVPIGWNTPAR